VIAQSIRQVFDHARPLAASRSLGRILVRFVDGEDVVAIHADRGDSISERLLRERFRDALLAARNADRVAIIDD